MEIDLAKVEKITENTKGTVRDRTISQMPEDQVNALIKHIVETKALESTEHAMILITGNAQNGATNAGASSQISYTLKDKTLNAKELTAGVEK